MDPFWSSNFGWSSSGERDDLRIKRLKVWDLISKIDRDVLRSSSESTISTSWIRRIASEGSREPEHTSVLKLVFQHCKVEGAGNFCKLQVRGVGLRLSSHVLRHVSGKSRVRVVKLWVFYRFFRAPWHGFADIGTVGSCGADGSTKTSPGFLHKSRGFSCGLETRQSFPNELGTIRGWMGTWDNPELHAFSRS